MDILQLTPLQALWRSARLILETAPRQLRWLTFLSVIQGGGPTLVLLCGKVAIDEITSLVQRGTIDNPIAVLFDSPILLAAVGGTIALNLIVNSINTITNVGFSSLEQRVEGRIREQILQKVSTFSDIALFENPELLNILQLAEKAIAKLRELTFRMIVLVMGFFTLIPAVLVSGTIAWWIPLPILLASSPVVFVQRRHIKRSWDVEVNNAATAREMKLFQQMLMEVDYAKEVRLYNLQDLLLERWRSLFNNIFSNMETVRYQGTRSIVAWSLLSGVGIAIPYIYVVLGTLRGNYTLGDLALYSGIILQLRSSLFMILGSFSEVYEVALETTPVFQLLELEPQLRLQISERRIEKTPGIKFVDVSFTYPGSDRPSLIDINLTLPPGQTVALVGENGAGKTTLAKLLCRLYDPDRGAILWDGKDIRGWELEQLRRRIAVILQDYARFPVTVRENIGFGNLEQLTDDRAIRNAIDRAGLTTAVERLAQQLETPLGKQLEGGVDLSGGQWQRTAIARALMRHSDAELLIFDEPTAALDPKTESEIYTLLHAIARDKTAVVVTHRLALARMADAIVVLEGGKIVERGSHDRLMASEGTYHEMFARQARHYL